MREARNLSSVWLWVAIAANPLFAQSLSKGMGSLASPSLIERFETDIRPLFQENCSSCHSRSLGKVMGGLSLDNRQEMLEGGESGAAIDTQSPMDSLLLEAVRRESFEMPPDKPLSPRQIAVLEKWITEGAPWPEYPSASPGDADWVASRASSHWAWQPIGTPSVPMPNWEGKESNSEWTKGPIDCFVLETLQKNRLAPPALTSPEARLRRLTFDLTGLPPSVAQQQDFRSWVDTDEEDAIRRAVDLLLASPQFGVHWGRHWLDLMRYAETLGHEFDYPIRHAWRYRDGVVDALNDDLDYRQFITEHLAGDQIQSPRLHPLSGVNQSLSLTGWWWLGDSVHAPVDIKMDLATRVENQIDVLSKAFLGMTVACARCHDHKFDAISTEDYYGLFGIANSSRRRYAITDPHSRIENHINTLRDRISGANQVGRSAWQNVTLQSVQRWLAATVAQLQSFTSQELDQALPPNSPLYPLRILVEGSPVPRSALSQGDRVERGEERPFGKKLLQIRQQLEELSEAYGRWVAESPLFAQFDKGLPPGWTLEAIGKEVWEHPPGGLAEQGLDWLDGNYPAPSRQGIFSDSKNGRHQSVTLRSPNFEVSQPVLCLKMRGRSTQSCIIVSNYFMGEFHGLLFGDLRKPIDQNVESGWVTHAGDLHKYLGHPAFISLEDEGQAWFELSEVRFADRQPPVEPNAWALELLNSPVEDVQSFEDRVAGRLYGSIERWREAQSPSEVPVIRSMLQLAPAEIFGEEYAEKLQKLATEIQRVDQQVPEPTRILAIEEGAPREEPIHLRGNPHRPGQATARNCFKWLPSWQETKSDSSGRRELAESFVSNRNPLVARVLVNRVWHHLMGEGLMATTDNFGVLGSRPTHPELLNWLTMQFMQQHWSIKWLIREIVTSRVYAVGSEIPADAQEFDPDGGLYSHRPIRRLTAESLRDAILATCGELDSRIGGPSVPVYLSEEMTGRGRPQQSGPLDGNGRRSLYVEVRRNFLSPFLSVFDFPMPSTTCGRRNRSNLPSQALCMLNDPFVSQMSLRWANATATEEDWPNRVRQMIQSAFSRNPTQQELEDCLGILDAADPNSWEDLAHILLNAKSFGYVR